MAYADPSDFWQDFGVDNLDQVECTTNESLAVKVLRDYGIPYTGGEGGSLSNLDIKHMDALSVIKMSLMEQSAEDDVIYEPMVNEDGYVEFNAIGEYSGNYNDDLYYEIQTGTYVEECVGVLVTGGKPLPYREPLEWTPIWITDERKEIYDMVNMDTNCMRDDFNRYCTIVFPDPHLESGYKDGIDNLYEITEDNAYASIMGYARYIDYPDKLDHPELTIEKSNSSTIPIEIGGADQPGGGLSGAPTVGNLQKRPEIVENPWDDAQCYEGTQEAADWQDGVMVPIPETFRFENVRETVVDKFTRVSSVYVVGMVIDYLASEPISNPAAFSEAPNQNDINRIAYVDATTNSVIKLDEGTHYVVTYDNPENQAPPTPYIVFSANSRKMDPANYGDNTTIDIVGGDYTTVMGGPGEYTGTILPIAQTKGIIVRQIFAMVDLETPCINIFHPDGKGNKAREIAENLEYLVAPLILVEEPPPIAYNGRLVRQEEGIKDHDPTTAQNLEDTEMDNIMDEMDGGGMSVSFSFLDGDGDKERAEEQVERLSNTLYDYMNSGDGIAATYVCGPNAEPRLGGTGADSKTVINSITYSYNDSNSYTISVNTGPKLVGGLASVTGGPTYKQVDSDISIKGTVIQDMGNHLYYKVRLDGYGDRVALNCCPKVIRVGDKVMCSIHNNPAEL